jgi:hypothetical protein
MVLLGGIRNMEIGGERAHQMLNLIVRGTVEAIQKKLLTGRIGMLAERPRRGSNLLLQLKERVAPLSTDHVAKDSAHFSDVDAQRVVTLAVGNHHASKLG